VVSIFFAIGCSRAKNLIEKALYNHRIMILYEFMQENNHYVEKLNDRIFILEWYSSCRNNVTALFFDRCSHEQSFTSYIVSLVCILCNLTLIISYNFNLVEC